MIMKVGCNVTILSYNTITQLAACSDVSALAFIMYNESSEDF